MDTFTLTEEQLLKIIEISREGSYFTEYTNGLPIVGKDYEFEPKEIITFIKRGEIN